MSGTSFSDWKSKLQAHWQKQVERSVEHPIRASLPFLAATVLILGTVITADNLTVCYTAAAQGQPLVFFQEEATYGEAVVQAEARASQILDTNYSYNSEDVTIRTALAPKSKLEDLPQVTDSIMETIPELEHVYTLSVDGELVGAAEDADVLKDAIALVQSAYTTPETRSVSIENQLSLHYEYLPADQGVTNAEDLAALLMEESMQTFSYTIQSGDTLESVTANFSMTEERLAELNPDIDYLAQSDTEEEEESVITETARQTLSDDEETVLSQEEVEQALQALTGTPLAEGVEITVEALSPRLVVTTVEEQTLSRDIVPEREDQADDTMYIGEERIIQEGELGEATVLARVVTRAGISIASTDLSSVTVTEATPMIVGVGTQEKPELPDGCLFLWPVQGRISSDFGYRFIFGENNFHRGVDIASSMGTAISAAMDGTVVFAGEKGSYGNLVILSHSNGFYTYYGHCSQLLVTAGQQVTQGEPIAAVGSTGRSTGPHCHFEVRYQGSPIDPLLYLPGSNNAPVRTVTPSSLLTPTETEDADKTTETAKPDTSTTTTTKPETTAPTTTTPVPETPATTEPAPEEPAVPDEPQDSDDLEEVPPADGSDPSAQALTEDQPLLETAELLPEETPQSESPTAASLSQPQDAAEVQALALEPTQEEPDQPEQ